MGKNPLATPCKHVAGSNPESDSLGLRGSPKLAFLARFPVTFVVGLLRHALNVTELWKYQSIFKQWSPTFLVLEGLKVSWEAVFTLSGGGGGGFRMSHACYAYCARGILYLQLPPSTSVTASAPPQIIRC